MTDVGRPEAVIFQRHPAWAKTKAPLTLTSATHASAGLSERVLKRFRRVRGLSQEALAERAAISSKAIGALETGLRKSPYPTTIALLADALRLDEAGRAELEAAATMSRAERNAAEDARAGDLPAPLTTIVGRADEVRELLSLLAAGRFVTIAGPGGIGKTTVALEVARKAQGRYTDGVTFCDLSTLRDGDLVASAIVSGRGLMLGRDRDPLTALVAALKRSLALLVLDNCEHLAAHTAAIVRELLRACPNLSVLATSRRRLGAPSEVVYRLQPLTTPPPGDDEHLTAERAAGAAAVTLFAQRAGAVDPQFALSDLNAADVARICRRLDGIPLAIELAAAQMRVATASELERRLGQRFRLLREGTVDAESRGRTLLATFDWSYDLLDAREQRFFRALGIFAGSFPLEAALEICCADGSDELQALELLAALVDASLVVADAGGDATRFRLLETTRAYAADAMAEHGECPALATRHLLYYRAYARELDITMELEDVRAALRWALDGGDHLAGAHLLVGLGARWSFVGLVFEGISRLEAFLPLVPEDDVATAAEARITLSLLQGETLRFRPALEEVRSALALARRSGDDRLMFAASRTCALFAALLGAFGDAEAALGEAAEAAARKPSPRRAILLRYTEGVIFGRRGEPRKALEAFRRGARPRTGTLGDAYLQVYAGGSQAEAEHENGNTAAAAAMVSSFRADPALKDIHDAASLANLVGYQVALGNDSAAFAAARELLALRSSRPIFRVYMTLAIEHIALAPRARNRNDARAARLAGYCHAWYREVGYERQYTEAKSHERLLEHLRKALSTDQLAILLADGATLSAEAAIREAMEAPTVAGDGAPKP